MTQKDETPRPVSASVGCAERCAVAVTTALVPKRRSGGANNGPGALWREGRGGRNELAREMTRRHAIARSLRSVCNSTLPAVQVRGLRSEACFTQDAPYGASLNKSVDAASLCVAFLCYSTADFVVARDVSQ